MVSTLRERSAAGGHCQWFLGGGDRSFVCLEHRPELLDQCVHPIRGETGAHLVDPRPLRELDLGRCGRLERRDDLFVVEVAVGPGAEAVRLLRGHPERRRNDSGPLDEMGPQRLGTEILRQRLGLLGLEGVLGGRRADRFLDARVHCESPVASRVRREDLGEGQLREGVGLAELAEEAVCCALGIGPGQPAVHLEQDHQVLPEQLRFQHQVGVADLQHRPGDGRLVGGARVLAVGVALVVPATRSSDERHDRDHRHSTDEAWDPTAGREVSSHPSHPRACVRMRSRHSLRRPRASDVLGIWDDVGMRVNDWLVELLSSEPQVRREELSELRDAIDAEATSLLDASGVPVDDGPVVVSKSRLAQLDRCERSTVASWEATTPPEPPSVSALAGRALDHFVAQVLVGGRLRESSHDLRAALVAHGDHEALGRIDEWEGGDDGVEFDRCIDGLAAAVLDAWTGVDPSWAPRTQVPAVTALAGGRLRVSGVVDVELGGPHTTRPGVVVEVKSGAAAASHRHETYLYGLLVALRDGTAPAVVAQWYPGTAPAGVAVTIGVLEAAAERLLAGVRQWSRLLAGAPPSASPGVWCGWCRVQEDCDVAPVADGGKAVAVGDGDEAEYTPEVEGEQPW